MSSFVSSEDAFSVDEFDSLDLETKNKCMKPAPLQAGDSTLSLAGTNRSRRSISTTASPATTTVNLSKPLFVSPSNGPRTIGNFHDYYLELGQWPDMTPEKQAEVSSKYALVKSEYNKNLHTIQELESQIQEVKQTPCTNCKKLEASNKSSKQALEEAVQLSNILLTQLYKFNSNLNP